MSLNVFTDYIENCTKEGIEPSWEGLRVFKKVKKKEDKKVNTYSSRKKIVNGVIENEFNHIQETREMNFCNSDIEYKQAQLMTEIIRKVLEKNMTEEQLRLLDEFNSALINELMNVCKFYFREGLSSGLTNLKFLNEIDNVEYMI